jgi:hypothetical protein
VSTSSLFTCMLCLQTIFLPTQIQTLAATPDNSQLTGGFIICVWGGTVQMGSHFQAHVSLLSTKSEYTTASKPGFETMWMHYLFDELGYDMSAPCLFCW